MISKIQSLKAREILDSRGNPTVEVELATNSGTFSASVPSGVSRGKLEAVEIRDGGSRYKGMGVLRAVDNVKEFIAPKLKGAKVGNQREIDKILIELDGTFNKSKLGANAILAVSLAICRAGAASQNIPLYKYIAQIAENDSPLILPTPFLLCIEGGLHAGNALDIQEFMIAPTAGSLKERLEIGAETYHTLKSVLEKKYGQNAINVGDEGGFAAPLGKTEEALDLIIEASDEVGHTDKIKIGLDVAASSFYKNDNYRFEGVDMGGEELINFYEHLTEKYPFSFIEDPFAEEDWQNFQAITSKLGGRTTIIGDDFLVTNLGRIKKAREERACNGLLLKPNQIGTVSETIAAAQYAMKNSWRVVVSHRGGDTCDSFIADLAVGLGCGWIKSGAPIRGERIAKYNRLLRIEEELDQN